MRRIRIKHFKYGYYMGRSEGFDAPIFGGTKEEAFEFESVLHATGFIQNNCCGKGYLLCNCKVE